MCPPGAGRPGRGNLDHHHDGADHHHDRVDDHHHFDDDDHDHRLDHHDVDHPATDLRRRTDTRGGRHHVGLHL